jgi:small-conductance mechanosensitive channel
MTLIRRNRRKPNAVRFQLLWNRISLHPNEVGLIATLSAITGYMLWVSPAVLMTATVMGLIAIAFGLLNRSAQSVAGFGLPIQGLASGQCGDCRFSGGGDGSY